MPWPLWGFSSGPSFSLPRRQAVGNGYFRTMATRASLRETEAGCCGDSLEVTGGGRMPLCQEAERLWPTPAPPCCKRVSVPPLKTRLKPRTVASVARSRQSRPDWPPVAQRGSSGRTLGQC